MRDLRVHTGALELQVREYEHPGSPIIFLHYGGANLMMWQRAVPYFAGTIPPNPGGFARPRQIGQTPGG